MKTLNYNVIMYFTNNANNNILKDGFFLRYLCICDILLEKKLSYILGMKFLTKLLFVTQIVITA